jgi:hypothetical protein
MFSSLVPYYDLELDYSRNCLLIDELPQAVGVNYLPLGTLTATITGEGNIGGPSRPIFVTCLYKTTDG